MKSYLPHWSISTRTNWGQLLVSFRDFPYRLIDFLSIKNRSFFMRHSCRTNCRPASWLSAQMWWFRVVQASEKLFCKVAELEAKRNINRPLAILKQIKLYGCFLVKWFRSLVFWMVGLCLHLLSDRDGSWDFPQLPKCRNVSRENSRNDETRNSSVCCFQMQREKRIDTSRQRRHVRLRIKNRKYS